MPHLACSVNCFSSCGHCPLSSVRPGEWPVLPSWPYSCCLFPSHLPSALIISVCPDLFKCVADIHLIKGIIKEKNTLNACHNSGHDPCNPFSSSPSIASPSACHADYTSKTLHTVLFSLPLSHACLGHIISFLDFWIAFSYKIPEKLFSNTLNQVCAIWSQ